MTINEMIKELSGIFPYFFGDAVKAEGRASLYRRSMSHLSEDQLAAAYGETMRYWEPRKHGDPPLPFDILKHVRSGERLQDGTINMKAMCDALPSIQLDIEANWRQRSTAWLAGLIQKFKDENVGHEQAVEEEIRSRITALVKAKSNRHAQLVWQDKAALADFRLYDDDLDRMVGRPGKVDPVVIAIREGREPPISFRSNRKGRAA